MATMWQEMKQAWGDSRTENAKEMAAAWKDGKQNIADGIKDGMQKATDARVAFTEKVTGVGVSAAEKAGAVLGNPLGASLKAGEYATVKPTKFAIKGAIKGTKLGFNAGKYAAIGAALLGGAAVLANMGRKSAKPVQETNELDFDAATAFAAPEVPNAPVLPPIGANTLMGLPPVEGEHVAALGRGQSQGFAAQRAPKIAEDMRASNVSTGELSLGA